ncbi:MAG: ferredoxin [Myxococcota bacterium]|nr:ferredoxin [Myxococcota bacterium]
MRVHIKENECQGHGTCVMVCPEVFSADEQGFAVVENPEVPAALEDTVQRAESRCPERAIQLED